LGPELSWKYQSGVNDWLTTILQTCGSSIDIVTVHRYPIDPTKTTVAAAAADATNLNATIAHLRSIMQQAGVGDKPLAITEANITWDGDPAKSTMPASPGTVPAGLWAADTFGMGMQNGLWTMLYWSTREGWTLGLFPSSGMTPRPSYWALDLYANHFGPTLLSVTSTPDGVRVYASRNQADDATQLVVVNWNQASAILTFQLMVWRPHPPQQHLRCPRFRLPPSKSPTWARRLPSATAKPSAKPDKRRSRLASP
jgi:hypothetical protein